MKFLRTLSHATFFLGLLVSIYFIYMLEAKEKIHSNNIKEKTKECDSIINVNNDVSAINLILRGKITGRKEKELLKDTLYLNLSTKYN